jgi:hypothetical protein
MMRNLCDWLPHLLDEPPVFRRNLPGLAAAIENIVARIKAELSLIMKMEINNISKKSMEYIDW